MKLLIIETMISDEMAKEYMSLPIEQRGGYIQEMERKGIFRLEDFTTELEEEFEESQPRKVKQKINTESYDEGI
jgi:hypothetical protein